MKKAYLLVYSDAVGNRDDLKAYLSNLKEVITWRFDLPNCFYIISENSAKELSDLIRNNFSKGRYFITEISFNRQGYLPSESWYLIKNKATKPK